jgi:hypothetical protein
MGRHKKLQQLRARGLKLNFEVSHRAAEDAPPELKRRTSDFKEELARPKNYVDDTAEATTYDPSANIIFNMGKLNDFVTVIGKHATSCCSLTLLSLS